MSNTFFFELEEIYAQLLTMGYKFRDFGLLNGALVRTASNVFGEDSYSTIERKAAALFSSLVRDNFLITDNKVATWLITNSFLEFNGFAVKASDDEVTQFTFEIANKEEDLDEIEAFFVKHLVAF